MPREYPGYHDIDERLVTFRSEILERMRRNDELAGLPKPTRINLAAEAGTVVRVDSFLGTTNTENVDDVYFRVVDAARGSCELGTLPFATEDPTHPVLAALRERFDLPVIAGTGTDLERAVRVRDWIKSLFPHYIPYRMPPWNALTILDRASRGVENFICMHYSVSLVQCCLALGMQARMVNLHRGISDSYVVGDEAFCDPPVDEHVVAEIWCSESEKWVMLDADFDCHYERDGVPQSAWDIHNAFIAKELDHLACRRGPHSHAFTALAETIDAEDEFFAQALPAYYAHVSVLMRNDFLSDPDGPVQVAHLVDSDTGPILWHRGSDLRLQPHLMGPIVVANPCTDRLRLLTDGNLSTGWASADTATEHWVEITLPGERLVASIGLVWPEYADVYRTSRRLEVQAQQGNVWVCIATLEIDPEGPFTLHGFPVTRSQKFRVLQPAGGGFPAHPNRLWLTQVELFAPGNGDANVEMERF